MQPTILREPTLVITFGATAVDLSEWTRSVEPSSEAETVDIRTFAHPKAQANGAVTDGLAVTMLWAPALYAALSPFIDTEGALVFKADSADTMAVRCTVSYATLPWGTFELGQPVEVTLTLAVLTDITYS